MLTLALSLESLLFESPWPVVAGLAVVWAVMRLVGARLSGGERDALGKRLRTGSWGALGLAAVVLAVAWYVQTPRERMSAAAYADTRPRDPAQTEVAARLNRRIEIVLMPKLEELPDHSALQALLEGRERGASEAAPAVAPAPASGDNQPPP